MLSDTDVVAILTKYVLWETLRAATNFRLSAEIMVNRSRANGERNARLCAIITRIAEGLAEFSNGTDTLGDAYEYLLGQFAAGSGKKAGEFYTPQRISSILSGIVTLDSQEPKMGKKRKLDSIFDFACGSGSLLLNVRHRMSHGGGTIGKIFGME